MSQDPSERRLIDLARATDYPPTPDVWPSVARALSARPAPGVAAPRRWALGLALALLGVLAGVAAVPEARAAVMEVLRLGALRIVVPAPTTPPDSPPSATATSPAPELPAALADLDGEASLEEARLRLAGHLRLPAYPPDLGLPDRIYLQEADGILAVLVWFAPEDPSQVRLALYLVGPGGLAAKTAPTVIEETEVDGRRAVWVTGAHFLRLSSGAYELRSLVEGNVLIWEVDGFTLRLESALPLDQAVRIAESLR